MSKVGIGRMVSIDALRGIAAFLVVVFHAFGSAAIFPGKLTLERLEGTNYLYFFPAFGYSGVFLFFVISGFCIHLRWARSISRQKDSDPKIDFISFWKRRWVRLYPAYLAAMILFLCLENSQGKLQFNGFFIWDMISHVLMVHNLDNRTVYSMNGVFWTLAIEEQLYMLYFLLIYLRRKFGWGITLVVTFLSRFVWLGVSLLVTKGTGFELPFSEGALANWWIWTLGAIAVEGYFGVVKFPSWCYSFSLAALFLAIAGALHYAAFSTPATAGLVKAAFILESFLWGVGFFFLVNRVTSAECRLTLSVGSSRIIDAMAFMGLFSYSLYLTHELVLQGLPWANRFVLCFLCIAFAYLFFLLFEKPFMVYLSRQKSSQRLEPGLEAV